MSARPAAARGFPWLTHRTVAETRVQTCGKCGVKLDSRNTIGYCRLHHRSAHLPTDEVFAAFAEGKTAYFVSRRFGMHEKTAREWAARLGVTLAPAVIGRPQKRKPRSVIRSINPAPSATAKSQDAKLWCEQCERRVSNAQAAACRSQWCKVRIAA